MNSVLRIGGLFLLILLIGVTALAIVGFETPYIVEEEASDSVVLIETENSVGTGVIINEKQVLTSCHVVKNSNNIAIQRNQVKHSAYLVGLDIKTDLALLHVRNHQFNFSGVQVANKTRTGDTLYSYPYNGKEVSSVAVDAKKYLELEKQGDNITYFKGITGEVIPGYSGGPTFNSQGELSGIQFLSIYGERDEHLMSVIVTAQGLRDVVPDLQEHGEYVSGQRNLNSNFEMCKK